MNATQNFMNDTFKQMSDTFSNAFEMGMKFQKDNMRFWTEAMTGKLQSAGDQWKQAADEFAPTVQKNLDRFGKLVEEQTQHGVELMRKSFDCEMPQNPQGVNDRWLELWKASFDAMRDSADAVAKANGEMIDGFEKMTHKAVAKTTNGATPRAKSRGK